MLDFDVLLEAAFVKLGSDSPTELARAIGLSGDYRSRRVARWRKAGGADYEGTVLLLEYVGWLRVNEAAPAHGHAGGGSETTRAAADAAMGEAARVLEEAGRRILELAADLQPRQPGSSRRAGAG